MARERMITRTISDTIVTALCMDTNTCEVSRETYHLGNIESDVEVMLKVAQKKYQTDTFKIVKIEDFIKSERLYGMDEVVFMNYAIELDPETRKPL